MCTALGQKQTLGCLFDHLVGAALYRLRHSDPELLRGLEVDDQLHFEGKHDDQVDALGLVGQLMDKYQPGYVPKKEPENER
jgi:hypothetical protein